jgi:hypothetical protein
MKINDENKTVIEFNDKYFGYGVHSVKISDVTLGEAGDKEYIEVTVVDPEDLEITDSARVWFTSDKAVNYSFNVLRQIFVHCAPEAKKDEAREMFNKIGDTDTLAQIMEKCIGRQIWFTKYIDPERTYTDQQGNVRPSVNKNVMGYEPKLKPELLPKTGPMNMDGMLGKVNEVMPGSQEVPFESKGDAPGSHVPADDAWAK